MAQCPCPYDYYITLHSVHHPREINSEKKKTKKKKNQLGDWYRPKIIS